MITTHLIAIADSIDISKLHNFVSTIDGAAYVECGEDGYHYWIKGKSACGLAINFYDSYVEVLNQNLSNMQDYQLTNKIVREILETTEGALFDEFEEGILSKIIWNRHKIKYVQACDIENLKSAAAEGEDIVIEGSQREVYYGKRLHQKFKDLNDTQFKRKLFQLILRVNYKLPDFAPCDITVFEKHGKLLDKLVLLNNEGDFLITKYDYVFLESVFKAPIMITHEILNTMLPSNWTLVDEFTVVAPVADETEWNMLLLKAKAFDMWDDYLAS